MSSRETDVEESPAPNEPPSDERDRKALDELFRRSRRYCRAKEYREFLDFVCRFPQYSPYNAALLQVQNPGVSFTATRRQWRKRFDRAPEPGARPYVILQPFGPVLFVYDLTDTEPLSEEARELPKKVTDPFEVEGTLDEETWARTVRNCRDEEKVTVRLTSNFHRRHGGRVEPRASQAGEDNPGESLYQVLINEDLGLEEQYGVLAHELGHLFCGHLGTGENAWWDGRPDVEKSQKEIEAESVAYLVTRRAGLHPVSERYLHGHVIGADDEETLPPVRMRQVLDATHYIESMGRADFKSKRDDD